MSEIRVDTIAEKTTANGVSVDGVSLKDGGATLTDNLLFSASGKGVYLGVTSATASNLLDDYEQGTFTPTLNFGTATTQLGSYVKVGNVVHCFINLATFSDITTAATIQITLPFTCRTGNDYQSCGAVMYQYADVLNSSGLTAYMNDNVSYVQIYQNNTTAGWSPLRYVELNNSSVAFRIQLTYLTA